MAKTKFGLDFDGFLQMAENLDNLGREHLKKAVENALTRSKNIANHNILKAMKESPYAFAKNQQSNKGVGGVSGGKGKNRRATGKAAQSVWDTNEIPVEWNGNEAIAYIGPDLKEAPESIILALGTPHIQGDRNLNNALKVKGKYRKQVTQAQQEEFIKVLKEAQND